jgi:hypothetical protein
MFFSKERVSEYIPFEPRLGSFFDVFGIDWHFFNRDIHRQYVAVGRVTDCLAALQNKN